jgi:hypothetical protein
MNTATQTYNGYKNYDTWNVMLWLDNDEGFYKESLRYFELVRGNRQRPTYRGLIQWLSDGGVITTKTADDIEWLSDDLDYRELNRGIRINYDCWLEYN